MCYLIDPGVHKVLNDSLLRRCCCAVSCEIYIAVLVWRHRLCRELCCPLWAFRNKTCSNQYIFYVDVLIVLLFVRSTCTFQASRAAGTAEECEIMAEDKIGQVRGSWDKVICGAIRMFLMFFFPPSSQSSEPRSCHYTSELRAQILSLYVRAQSPDPVII